MSLRISTRPLSSAQRYAVLLSGSSLNKLNTPLVLTVFFLKTDLFLYPERHALKKKKQLTMDIEGDLETRNKKALFVFYLFLYSSFFPPRIPGSV